MPKIKAIDLPNFGADLIPPEISVETYRARLRTVCARMQTQSLDFLLIYGDREHSANMAYLTGFDPRFEEAILLLNAHGERLLLVGNECMGYLPETALGIQIELFQELSLMGQPRGASRSLREIFTGFGIGTGKKVGCVGWKYFVDGLIEGSERAIEIPAYLVDLLRNLTVSNDLVINANDLFMNPRNGLRVINEVEQIASFEHAASVTSSAVLNMLRALCVGAQEREMERYLDAQGLPLSCHRMMSFGQKVKRGLSSPSFNTAKLGDAYAVAFGVAGGLTCRAGVMAHNGDDLAPPLRDFYLAFAKNYFDVVTAWYRSLRIGVTGGAVFHASNVMRNADLYDFAVNPGHYLHLDEWVHSPFYEASDIKLVSGMVIQMDIIPISRGPFCYVNAEDGVVLADDTLRAELKTRFPACWQRIQHRRQFMQNQIGITLDESVLPLSNIPAWLAPFALDLKHAFAAE